MLSVGNSCPEGRGITSSLVRRNSFRRYTCLVNSPLKERLRCSGVPPLREEGVNNLPIFINGAVDIRPAPLQTDICLIDAPLGANSSSVSACGIAEKWKESLDPAVDRTAINDATTLGEPLHDVGVAQSIAHVPAYSQGDDIIGEGMIGEGAGGAGGKPSPAIVAAPSLAAESGLPIASRSLAATPDACHDQPLPCWLRSVILLPIRLQQYLFRAKWYYLKPPPCAGSVGAVCRQCGRLVHGVGAVGPVE